MKIELDGDKLLSQIFELDGSVHTKIKEQVEDRLVTAIVDHIENTYFKNSWHGQTDEIMKSVIEEVKEKQEEVVKKILKDFYDSYRYAKQDITILKKLKELIGEN